MIAFPAGARVWIAGGVTDRIPRSSSSARGAIVISMTCSVSRVLLRVRSSMMTRARGFHSSAKFGLRNDRAIA